MSDYIHYPPFKYFTTVLKSCPEAAYLYTLIWRSKDASYAFEISKAEVPRIFFLSPTKFRNQLYALGSAGVLYVKEDTTYETFRIELND